jgi:SPP1 gp7 family putative phage head morphogenesis protein
MKTQPIDQRWKGDGLFFVLEELPDAGDLAKHDGPGPHPGTGTSQDVHGGGGGGESTGVSAYDDPEGFSKDPANAVLPSDMVNELDGGPGASIQYHGSSGFIPVNGKFKDPETYITPQADEANGYAFGMHRMQSNPNGYRITVRRKPGKTLNMSDAIMEGFDAGVEPDEIIARLAPAARAAGFRYLYHDHPSFGSNEIQHAVISLYPNEDLKILNSKRVYNKSLPAGTLAKHDGPGEHESGSPQSVHGGGGGGKRVTKQEAQDLWYDFETSRIISGYSAGEKNPESNSFYEFSKEELGRLKQASEIMQDLASKQNSKQKILYRGVAYDTETRSPFDDFSIGEDYTFERLSSSAVEEKTASIYLDPQYAGQVDDKVIKTLLIMENPNGIRGHNLRTTTDEDVTGEIVLPKGLKFTVTDMYEREDGILVVMLYSNEGGVHKIAGDLAKAAPALPPGFWEEEMRRLAIILIPRLTSLVLEGMRSGTVKVGIGFNFAIYSVLAAQWAQDYTDQLLQQVRTTNESVVGDILARWIATPGRTIGDLRAALTPHFGVQRADTIAITEATRALASGEIMAFQRAGIEEIRWGTNNDELVCPHCGPLHGVVRKIGEVFGYFKWRKGAALEPVFSPPFHPNCRCGISPVVKLRRSAWGDVPNSLIVSATLAMIRPGGWDYAGDLAKHEGPGPHPGTGTPQDVHGGDGAGAEYGGRHGAAKNLKYYSDRIKTLDLKREHDKTLGWDVVTWGPHRDDPDFEMLYSVDGLQKRIDKYGAEEYDSDTAEYYIEGVEKGLQEEMEKNEVFVRVTPENLEKVVEDGKLKNTFDNKKTSAPLKANKVTYKRYREERLSAEDKLMGVDRESTDRPVYGYLSKTETGRLVNAPHNVEYNKPEEDDPFLEGYGSVSLKLKPAVKERSTWSNIDSLDSQDRIRTSPITKPSYFSMWEGYNQNIIRSESQFDTDKGTYWEAQIFGGVTLGDIDTVFSRDPLPESLTKRLDEEGIKWTIVK